MASCCLLPGAPFSKPASTPCGRRVQDESEAYAESRLRAFLRKKTAFELTGVVLRFRLEQVYSQLFSPVNQVAISSRWSCSFKMLMNPQLGQLNQILKSVGIPPSQFLTSHETALYSVIGVDIWKALGFYVVILTAGMLNIPEEIYDAAKVDGASIWQRFWRVTLPLLGHTLTLVSVLIVMQRFAGIHPGCGHALASGRAGQCHLRFELARIQRSPHQSSLWFRHRDRLYSLYLRLRDHRCAVADSAAKLELLNAIG